MVPPDYRFQVFRMARDGTGLRALSADAAGISEHPSS
jgi:hypothetical protein